MKKIYLGIILLVLTLLFTSCSLDFTPMTNTFADSFAGFQEWSATNTLPTFVDVILGVFVVCLLILGIIFEVIPAILFAIVAYIVIFIIELISSVFGLAGMIIIGTIPWIFI